MHVILVLPLSRQPMPLPLCLTVLCGVKAHTSNCERGDERLLVAARLQGQVGRWQGCLSARHKHQVAGASHTDRRISLLLAVPHAAADAHYAFASLRPISASI